MSFVPADGDRTHSVMYSSSSETAVLTKHQKGTKVPGGFLLPVSVVRKEEKIPAAVQKMKENPVCLVQ